MFSSDRIVCEVKLVNAARSRSHDLLQHLHLLAVRTSAPACANTPKVQRMSSATEESRLALWSMMLCRSSRPTARCVARTRGSGHTLALHDIFARESRACIALKLAGGGSYDSGALCLVPVLMSASSLGSTWSSLCPQVPVAIQHGQASMWWTPGWNSTMLVLITHRQATACGLHSWYVLQTLVCLSRLYTQVQQVCHVVLCGTSYLTQSEVGYTLAMSSGLEKLGYSR
jgi:hypothetical protein